MSYLPLYVLTSIGELGMPMPIIYESALLLAGFKLSRGVIYALWTIPAGALGALTGSSITFWIARILGRRVGKRLSVPKRHKQKFKELVKKLTEREVATVTVGRLTPGLLFLTSVAAGGLNLSYTKFILGVLMSTLIWAGAFTAFGFFFGEASQSVTPYISVVAGILGFGIFFFLLRGTLRRKFPLQKTKS